MLELMPTVTECGNTYTYHCNKLTKLYVENQMERKFPSIAGIFKIPNYMG